MKTLIIKKKSIKYEITYLKNKNIFIFNNLYIEKILFYDFLEKYFICYLKKIGHLKIELNILKRRILKDKLKKKTMKIILYNYLELLY